MDQYKRSKRLKNIGEHAIVCSDYIVSDDSEENLNIIKRILSYVREQIGDNIPLLMCLPESPLIKYSPIGIGKNKSLLKRWEKYDWNYFASCLQGIAEKYNVTLVGAFYHKSLEDDLVFQESYGKYWNNNSKIFDSLFSISGKKIQFLEGKAELPFLGEKGFIRSAKFSDHGPHTINLGGTETQLSVSSGICWNANTDKNEIAGLSDKVDLVVLSSAYPDVKARSYFGSIEVPESLLVYMNQYLGLSDPETFTVEAGPIVVLSNQRGVFSLRYFDNKILDSFIFTSHFRKSEIYDPNQQYKIVTYNISCTVRVYVAKLSSYLI